MSYWPWLIVQVVVVGAAIMILRRVLSQHFIDAASRLQDLSAEYTRRQEELKERLGESERQYQEQLAEAKQEAERVVAEAHREADTTKAARLEEARVEGERIVQQALETKESLRRELEGQMERRAIERACELIDQSLPDELRTEIQGQWLDELFKNGLAQFDRLKQQGGAGEVTVTTALPLTEPQRKLLHAKLKERLHKEIAVTEQVDAKLVAGLTIAVGDLVLDGSLASRLQRAARHAKEQAA